MPLPPVISWIIKIQKGFYTLQVPAYLGKKGKSFPYLLLSVGPAADPDVQAVSPQVTISHPSGGRLPLLSARPAVTFPPAEHHRPLAGTKLYCIARLLNEVFLLLSVIGLRHYLEFSKRRWRTGHCAWSAGKPADSTDTNVGNRLGAEVAADKNLGLTAAASLTHSTPEHVEFRPAVQQTNNFCHKLSILQPASAQLRQLSIRNVQHALERRWTVSLIYCTEPWAENYQQKKIKISTENQVQVQDPRRNLQITGFNWF